MFCYSNLMPKLEEAQNAVEHPQQRRERVRQQQEEEDKTRWSSLYLEFGTSQTAIIK